MKDYQNYIKPIEPGKQDVRQSFFSKTTKKHYVSVVAAIFAVIVLHLAAQFIFFRSENSESEISSFKIENEQPVEIKTEYETKTPDIIEKPVLAPPVVKPKPAAAAPPRTVLKKREPRESRTERLRRAEKILTGI